jgi:hypothetical protein
LIIPLRSTIPRIDAQYLRKMKAVMAPYKEVDEDTEKR